MIDNEDQHTHTHTTPHTHTTGYMCDSRVYKSGSNYDQTTHTMNLTMNSNSTHMVYVLPLITKTYSKGELIQRHIRKQR